MSNLWWQNHRLMTKGARGPDVEKAQRALNDFGADPELDPDGVFGGKTETAVIAFQELMNLDPDGKLGPVTQSVLMTGSYRFELRQPPHIPQGTPNLCWAACLEAVLGVSWLGRPKRTISELRTTYAAHLGMDGEIDVAGLKTVVAVDFSFKEILTGGTIRAEGLLKALRGHKPILIVDNSTGSIMHTRVIYGVKISKGDIDVLMMDPMAGHVPVALGSLQGLTRIGLFAPNEVKI